MKTQTKTTLLLLSAFLVIILLFSGYVFFSVSRYSYDEFYRLLEIRAITTAKTELDDAKSVEVLALRDEFFEKLPHEKDFIFKVEGSTVLQSFADSIKIPVGFFHEIMTFGKARHNNQNIFFTGIKYQSKKGLFIVIASAENYFEMHQTAYLKRTLFFAITSAFLFSLIISFYLSKYIFKPLKKITEKVKQISSESLHLRLEIKNNKDELQELMFTFNNMLDRIETSFETQNNFISNASHELRTPLTAIIGEADVTLSKLRRPEEYIETIKIILDEAEKLDKKTQALLFLAQTGFNGKSQKFEKVRMDQLIWDVKETIEKINPKGKIQYDLSLLPENPKKLKVFGSEQLLHLAFTNIIINACKYSNFEPVIISIGASNEKVFVVIKDKGIGIPEKELKYIYDPFFRASNTNNFEGYGIGLPLTRNIIRMHKGELIVSSQKDRGTVVEVILPVGIFSD